MPKSTTASGLAEAGIRAARVREAASVQLPYLGIALTLAVIAIALTFVRLPTIEFTRDIRPGQVFATTADKLRDHPQLFLGVAGIFCYVGAEVAIGSFLISYLELPNIGHFSAARASVYVSLYWGGAMVGRFVGAAVLRRFSTGRVLAGAAAVAASLVVASMLTIGHVAMITIIAVGVFNSVMFPSIVTLGIADLGPLTGRGSSLMVAAIVGGALIPLIQGRIADSAVGLHHAFLLPVLCYLYIAVFGWTRPSPLRIRRHARSSARGRTMDFTTGFPATSINAAGLDRIQNGYHSIWTSIGKPLTVIGFSTGISYDQSYLSSLKIEKCDTERGLTMTFVKKRLVLPSAGSQKLLSLLDCIHVEYLVL